MIFHETNLISLANWASSLAAAPGARSVKGGRVADSNLPETQQAEQDMCVAATWQQRLAVPPEERDAAARRT